MEKNPNQPADAAELRRQAEERLNEKQRGQRAEVGGQRPAEDTARLVHELQVQQIELEMQNEELRRAQAELEAGRTRYFDLYDLAPVGYCTLSEKGLILEANLTLTTLLGVNPSELVKQPLSRFILKDDQDLCYLLLKQLFKTHSADSTHSPEAGSPLRQGSGGQAHSTGSGQAREPQACDLRLLKPDGAPFWAHLTAIAAQAEDGAPLCRVMLSDITDRKQAEINLKEREGLLEKIFDILPIGLWFADKHGKLLRGNPAGVKIWGAEPCVEPAQYGVFKARRLPSGEEIAPDDWALAHSIREGTTTLDELLEIDAFDGRKRIILNSTAPVLDDNGAVQGAVIVNQDITERQRAGESLKHIEWLLTSRPKASDEDVQSCMPPYGNLVELNTCRLILDSVGEQTLADIVRDYLRLLDTSSSVYEKNGDYALGIFSSGWCRTLDAASRRVCGTNDNRTALNCGQWHCHESCWSRASKTAIETGQPTDIECDGGIRLYAVPIRVGDEIIGAINIGYGDPPRDEEKLRELASRYQVSYEELRALSISYESRPAFITDLAKDRLQASARLIGVITARKQAEAVLRESEERFKAIANYAVSWESWFGPEGKYLWVNPAVKLFTGYSAQEILALPDFVSTLIANEDRAMFMGRFQDAICGSRGDNFEFRYLHQNGTKRWLSVSWQPIYDAQGHPLGTRASGYDITARKQAEDELRASQQLAESIIESIPGTFYMLDEACKYVRWSACQRDEIVGKPDAEIAGFPALDTIHPEDRALVQARFANVLRTGVVETVEGRVLLRGGPKFQWFLMTGRRLVVAGHPYLVGIGIDITTRKEAEAKLHEQLDELRRWQVVTLGREDRVQELKREVNEACRRLGEAARYTRQETGA